MAKMVRTFSLVPGMVVADNVFSRNLELLVEKNTPLTTALIAKLENWRIPQVLIAGDDDMESMPATMVPAAASAPPVAAPVTAPVTAPPAPAAVAPALARQYNANMKQGDSIRRESVNITQQMLDRVRSKRPVERNMTQSIVAKLIGETVSNQRILTTLLAVRQYDNYIFTHLLNVSVLSLMTGQALGLKERELNILGEAALLHDIGMSIIPPEIWNKPDPLTAEERFQIQKHPVFSADLLEQVSGIEPETVRAVYQHHEREDGSGYPKGLTGDRINEYAKIIAVADCYDAMVNPRAFRPGRPPLHVMRELLQKSGTQLNREVLKVFVAQLSLYPVGSVVRLNTGATGVTVSANTNAPMRPVVKVMRDARGAMLPTPLYLDLRKDKKTYIVESILDQPLIDAMLRDSRLPTP